MNCYSELAQAIEKLFSPLAEVVIHDLATQKISHIYGVLSQRKVGDDSLIDLSSMDMNAQPETYIKLNFDGRLIKSISVPLLTNGEVTALMCINCDISIFEALLPLATTMVAAKSPPTALFALDWQEEVNKCIHSHINKMHWDFKSLSMAQKKALVFELYVANAFLNKNAADYVALALSMGRATIFNYLKTWKQA